MQRKSLALLCLVMVAVGCQTGRKKAETPAVPPPAPMPREFGRETEPPMTEAEEEEEAEKPREEPKLAVILGPGGARAYAHAGVLQELHRLRVPLVAIGGLEMGALPASLYANKAQGFDAEWQMMKLKEDDFVKRGLISGQQPKDLREWKEYLRKVFGSSRIEDGRVPFGCMTVNLDRQHVLIMNRGSFAQALPYCLAFPPVFHSYDRHVAGATQLASMVRYFRQKGATHVLYVDVLGEKSRPPLSSQHEVGATIWNLTASGLELQTNYVQEVLKVPLSDQITAFGRRRDMVKRGREAAAKQLPGLLKKMGFDR